MEGDSEEWFEAIDCDDEEFVRSLATKTPSLLDQFYEGAEYPEELKDLAEELMGKLIGPLTPLEYACFVESEDTALVLAELCTDLQISHRWGASNTIFHLVAFNGMERVLRKLLRRGIPSTNKNKAGFRPVDCVANDATRDVFANFRDEENLEGSLSPFPFIFPFPFLSSFSLSLLPFPFPLLSLCLAAKNMISPHVFFPHFKFTLDLDPVPLIESKPKV